MPVERSQFPPASSGLTRRSRAPTNTRSTPGYPINLIATRRRTYPEPQALTMLPSRHGLSLRGHHRFLEVQVGQRVVD